MKVLTAVKRIVSSADVQLWATPGSRFPSCRRVVLPLMLAAFCLPAVGAQQLDLYVWPVTGVVNVEHGEPSDGLAMDVMQAVLARMPDRDPHFRLGNRARLQRNMAAGANLCALPLLREPQGDDVGYFIPLFASTPIRVVMRHRQLERFPIESGRLSLAWCRTVVCRALWIGPEPIRRNCKVCWIKPFGKGGFSACRPLLAGRICC